MLPPDGREETVIITPVVVDPITVQVLVGENAVRNRRRQEVVVWPWTGGWRQKTHPLQRKGALLAGWNFISGKWGTRDDPVGDSLGLWIVDRNTQVGEVAGSF